MVRTPPRSSDRLPALRRRHLRQPELSENVRAHRSSSSQSARQQARLVQIIPGRLHLETCSCQQLERKGARESE